MDEHQAAVLIKSFPDCTGNSHRHDQGSPMISRRASAGDLGSPLGAPFNRSISLLLSRMCRHTNQKLVRTNKKKSTASMAMATDKTACAMPASQYVVSHAGGDVENAAISGGGLPFWRHITRHTPAAAKLQIQYTDTYARNRRNGFMLRPPTQLPMQPQWWSILSTHRSQIRQWCARGGLAARHLSHMSMAHERGAGARGSSDIGLLGKKPGSQHQADRWAHAQKP